VVNYIGIAGFLPEGEWRRGKICHLRRKTGTVVFPRQSNFFDVFRDFILGIR
jgi:hypothetical protein